MKTDLTAARARELFSYDCETGRLTWRLATNGRIRVGALAGFVGDQGYRLVRADRHRHLEHRVIWLIQTGTWPVGQIDHRNGERSDNRWPNLRDVPCAVNNQNQRHALPNNKTGFLGVSPERSLFKAEIQLNGRTRYLGAYKTPELAYEAYLAAKRQMHIGCTI